MVRRTILRDACHCEAAQSPHVEEAHLRQIALAGGHVVLNELIVVQHVVRLFRKAVTVDGIAFRRPSTWSTCRW